MRRETERVKDLWDRNASRYDRQMNLVEKLIFGGGREWVCSRATGEVLEVGVGTGRNLPFYPRDTRLTGVDLSPAMLEIARERVRGFGIEAELLEGDAQALPFPDASFDTVVCALALCNIPDDRQAVAEMKRVLRPGGWLLLLDHVRSTWRPVRGLQRLLEPLALRFEGDHLLRRPLEHVLAEGFEIEEIERYKLGIVERLSARKPG
jgi:ubiquinone/menaquinone biosynthesis C-methylase UbiE